MKSKFIIIKFFLVLIIFYTCIITPKSFPQQLSEKISLYNRLGGYDAIASVIDDFLTILMNEPQISKYFVGFSNDSKLRIRQHMIEFICQETGGPCYYTGKDIKTMHKGLGITESQWGFAEIDFKESLDKNKIGQEEQMELLSVISNMKSDIVEK